MEAKTEIREKQPTRPMTEGELERQRRVREIPFKQKLLLYPLSVLLRTWLWTLRIRVDEQTREFLKRQTQSLIVVFWHNRLFISADLRRRFRPFGKMNGLVSPSKDGAWLAAFFGFMGIGTVRGSTSRRGGQAMLEIYHKLSRGEDVAITPDGPRGPRYKFNPGAALIAQKTHCPIALVGSEYHCAIRLKSWDGFIIPLPFSRVDLCAKFYPYEKMWDHISAHALAEYFSRELLSITKDQVGA